MRSIDLTTYKVKNPFAQDGSRLEDFKTVLQFCEKLDNLPEEVREAMERVIQGLKDELAGEATYDVKNSLIQILFAPNQGLTATEILYRDDLARKIRDCAEDTLLLEESEYEKVKTAVNAVTGFGVNDVTLIKRVIKAPAVEVQEKVKESAPQ
jgi:hypothetical protein